ncbi:MAG TPA: hypothetical protein V6C89_21160 [Drouetiella sp.]
MKKSLRPAVGVALIGLALIVLALSAYTAARASSPHPPGFLYPTAGVVSYNSRQSSGLSAVYNSNITFGNNHLPGYVLTGSSAAGQVGWNIPSLAGGNATVQQFYGAKIYIASGVNFATTVPFEIVVQTSDGVAHTCNGTRGTYRFHPAQGGAPAYSSFTAYGDQFTPTLGLGDSTIQKTAFIFTGSGTVGFTGAVVQGGNTILVPGHYSYATVPDNKFNFQ